ncbi:YceI family protein [Agrilutibacter solisilvae]|uniref:Polyisoprenoid-binding protein n=1 Tax=Agrilutibacter solisilvae TaxID=2763317 RepID=A0A974Y0Q6_9GAMM|nr:YceI family protein [Lysobacter solisilvae]QSX78423.1 polyisoprenoid-binding protein [Lysobacter solisilvae]
MSLRWLAIAALACIPFCGHAQDDEHQFALDPIHTRVVLGVSHAGFSQAVGTISGSTGTVRFDPDDWSVAQVDVTVPLQRLDLGDAEWNTAVLAPRLLDAQRHPQARFVSTRVEAIDAQHARACGELTLRGVTGPVCLDVTFNQLKRHPLPPFRRTAGFSAVATLSRKAFGITAWPTVIGDEVTLRIEAEAVRGQPRAPDAPAAQPGAENPVAPPPPQDAGTAGPEPAPIPPPAPARESDAPEPASHEADPTP